MFTITVFHGARHLTYESEVLPQVGDIYPAGSLFDDNQYTVSERILSTKYIDVIVITVVYSHPNLVKDKLPEISNEEMELISKQHLS